MPFSIAGFAALIDRQSMPDLLIDRFNRASVMSGQLRLVQKNSANFFRHFVPLGSDNGNNTPGFCGVIIVNFWMRSEFARIGFARRKNLSMGYSSVASGESKQNRFRFADAIHDRMAAGVERYSQAVRAGLVAMVAIGDYVSATL